MKDLDRDKIDQLKKLKAEQAKAAGKSVEVKRIL
tara:strand:- start:169 stop:270 length:102 start_codon:yes stop_codon:yes gene_type:complete